MQVYTLLCCLVAPEQQHFLTMNSASGLYRQRFWLTAALSRAGTWLCLDLLGRSGLKEAANVHALVALRRGFVSAAFTAWRVFSPQKSMTFPNVAP